MAPQPESDVLSPRDPSIHTNSDEWPEFQLTNVRVGLPDDPDADGTTCLLQASEHYPLTVTGDLQPLPKPLSHLYLKPSAKRTVAIELPEVRTFAYGQFGNGNIAIWAAGKAGWYTITPARAYRSVYNNMIEAVAVLYFIADAYREPRMSGKGRNSIPLPDYSVDELFEKLVQAGISGATDISQAAELVYKHRDFLMASMMVGKEGMVWTKKPVYIHLRKRFAVEHKAIAKRLAGPSKKATASLRVRQASVETSSSTSSLKRKRGRPPKDLPQMDVTSVSSDSVAGVSKKDARNRVDPFDTARKAHGGRTAVRRTRRNSSTSSDHVKADSVEPHPAATPTQEESEDDEEVPYPRKGKSVLRLKPTVASKGIAKARPKQAEDSDEAEADPGPFSPTTGKGKSDEDLQRHQTKRRKSRQDQLDEGIDMPTSPSDPATPSATLGAHAEDDMDPSALGHVPDQVQEDTWLCALDGCTHKVYAASNSDSQRLIREHYALHAYDDDQRVKMVKSARAPFMPVERLMEKVRLQAKLDGFPGSKVAGTRFPVVQKY